MHQRPALNHGAWIRHGNSKIGAQLYSEIGKMMCYRHLLRLTAITNLKLKFSERPGLFLRNVMRYHLI